MRALSKPLTPRDFYVVKDKMGYLELKIDGLGLGTNEL